ncbi:centrosomal protein of 19 kDa-like isoform X2 [Cimex lectularius]|uniref:Centrosomal protein of 19 kDa n=1 Tax=Cimex lectularius TaxID=79782 RepID=A0A8I6S166_CIMLE|nr:centrosomal protein of 19 kDa-like isoform X2 [Cimex lectularius]
MIVYFLIIYHVLYALFERMKSVMKKGMVLPRKVGVRIDPPAVILVYDVWGKMRMRTMPVRNVWDSTSSAFILEDLKSRHDVLNSVPDSTILKMIEVLKRVKKGDSLQDALKTIGSGDFDEKNKELTPNVTKDKTLEDQGTRSNDEDTDFELEEELPLDDLSDDFWNLKPAVMTKGTKF